jgi:succinate-acetate transporter protein
LTSIITLACIILAFFCLACICLFIAIYNFNRNLELAVVTGILAILLLILGVGVPTGEIIKRTDQLDGLKIERRQ